MGARGEHWPVGMKTITPYVVNVDPNSFVSPNASIRTLNIERTFWEKATILHMYAHYPEKKSVPIRQSRHFYDFYRLLHSEAKELAIKNKYLLPRVSEHKKLYFPANWAKYDDAKAGSLKLIPKSKLLDEFKKDYSAMSDMIYGDQPSWNAILETIQSFETDFNKT